MEKPGLEGKTSHILGSRQRGTVRAELRYIRVGKTTETGHAEVERTRHAGVTYIGGSITTSEGGNSM